MLTKRRVLVEKTQCSPSVHDRYENIWNGELERVWPDPTTDMLNNIDFNAIWDAIKDWDISVPKKYDGYCGATGNHARAILDELRKKGCL